MTITNDADANSSGDAGDTEAVGPNGAIIDLDEAREETAAEPTPSEIKAELVKASKAAIDEENAKSPKTPAKPAADVAEEGDAEPSDVKGIARVLKQREKLNGEREETRRLRDEAASDRAEAKRVREESEKTNAEMKAFLKKLRESPAEAIKSAGWDPDELVLGLAKGDSPEGRATRKQATIEDELKSLKERLAERDAREETDRKERQRLHEETATKQAKEGFLKTALAAEKYPTLAKIYTKRPHLLVAEAERVADDYYAKTAALNGGRGQYATWDEIAEYLESDHSDATEQSTQVTGLRGASQAERAPGTRTVTTQRGSERRSAPKLTWDEMTEEQRKEAQLADFKAAMGKR